MLDIQEIRQIAMLASPNSVSKDVAKFAITQNERIRKLEGAILRVIDRHTSHSEVLYEARQALGFGPECSNCKHLKFILNDRVKSCDNSGHLDPFYKMEGCDWALRPDYTLFSDDARHVRGDNRE